MQGVCLIGAVGFQCETSAAPMRRFCFSTDRDLRDGRRRPRGTRSGSGPARNLRSHLGLWIKHVLKPSMRSGPAWQYGAAPRTTCRMRVDLDTARQPDRVRIMCTARKPGDGISVAKCKPLRSRDGTVLIAVFGSCESDRQRLAGPTRHVRVSDLKQLPWIEPPNFYFGSIE